MILGIIGSRGFTDYRLLCDTIDRYIEKTDITEVVSGGARGADSLGAQWARENGVFLTEFIPDWDKWGGRAGFIRNEDIVAGCDFLLAFWGKDPKTGKLSSGTANSLSIAKRLGKTTLIVYV